MNLANSNTTKTEDGTPYRRKTSIFRTVPMKKSFEEQLKNSVDNDIYGVEVIKIAPVPGDLKKIFDPTHPDADQDGYLYLPNVNLVEEMVQMLNANRSYEANASAIRAAKDMATKALEIGR
jgi:flagellar basal-body rod protein FlgC